MHFAFLLPLVPFCGMSCFDSFTPSAGWVPEGGHKGRLYGDVSSQCGTLASRCTPTERQ